MLTVILFGPLSLGDNGTCSSPKPSRIKWKLNEVTPGAIAFTAILVCTISLNNIVYTH